MAAKVLLFSHLRNMMGRFGGCVKIRNYGFNRPYGRLKTSRTIMTQLPEPIQSPT